MSECRYCGEELDPSGTYCLSCGRSQTNKNVRLVRSYMYKVSDFKGGKIKHSPDKKVFYPSFPPKKAEDK